MYRAEDDHEDTYEAARGVVSAEATLKEALYRQREKAEWTVVDRRRKDKASVGAIQYEKISGTSSNVSVASKAVVDTLLQKFTRMNRIVNSKFTVMESPKTAPARMEPSLLR